MTKTEALRRGLIAHGAKPVTNRANRYQTYALDLPVRRRDPSDGSYVEGFAPYLIFLGRSASLRMVRAGAKHSESMVAPRSLFNMLLIKGGYHD